MVDEEYVDSDEDYYCEQWYLAILKGRCEIHRRDPEDSADVDVAYEISIDALAAVTSGEHTFDWEEKHLIGMSRIVENGETSESQDSNTWVLDQLFDTKARQERMQQKKRQQLKLPFRIQRSRWKSSLPQRPFLNIRWSDQSPCSMTKT